MWRAHSLWSCERQHDVPSLLRANTKSSALARSGAARQTHGAESYAVESAWGARAAGGEDARGSKPNETSRDQREDSRRSPLADASQDEASSSKAYTARMGGLSRPSFQASFSSTSSAIFCEIKGVDGQPLRRTTHETLAECRHGIGAHVARRVIS